MFKFCFAIEILPFEIGSSNFIAKTHLRISYLPKFLADLPESGKQKLSQTQRKLNLYVCKVTISLSATRTCILQVFRHPKFSKWQILKSPRGESLQFWNRTEISRRTKRKLAFLLSTFKYVFFVAETKYIFLFCFLNFFATLFFFPF